MTRKQADLIAFIEDHGHEANTWYGDPETLEVHSHDRHGMTHSEVIPALWTRVKDWLGY